EGIGRLGPEHSVSSLYRAAAELLARDNEVGEAVELLREGIGRLGPEHSVSSLYRAAAELLARDNKVGEAVELLREGIGRVGPEHRRELVPTQAAILTRSGDYRSATDILVSEALSTERGGRRYAEHALLTAFGIQDADLLNETARSLEAVISESPGTRALVECLVLQLRDDWSGAAAVPAKPSMSSYATLLGEKAFSAMCAGDPEEASRFVDLMRERRGTSGVLNWIKAVVAYQRSDLAGVHRHLGDFVQRPLRAEELSDDLLWVRLWAEDQDFGVRPRFYFPRLPAVLTGLETDLTVS
ncbi:MAG TPA: hypothetical protein VFP72_07985, partial [Kineosporiaceae bacterium]|nr:hypothetical protein [Kineosporiaceae bacterium]